MDARTQLVEPSLQGSSWNTEADVQGANHYAGRQLDFDNAENNFNALP